MFQQISVRKIFPSLKKSFRLGYINKFSNDSTKNENSTSETINKKDSVENNSESSYNAEEVSELLKQSALYKDIHNKNWATTPYPKDAQINQERERSSVNPEETCVLLFPGQGTIKVGMVKKYLDYPGAKDLFEIANEILQYDLLKLCLNGPQQKLNKTEFNQPATVVSSLAALEKIREEDPAIFNNCVATAGYSVGEITALIVSGAITFEDGVKLVYIRGKAMQSASNESSQGMLSIKCKSQSKVAKACSNAEKWAMDMGVDNPTCRVAIFLSTQRKILAGHTEALQYINNHQTEFDLFNVKTLPVSGAFHTPLMQPALKSVSKVLNAIEFEVPRCHVYSNYKAAPYSNLKCMKKYILKQIISPVKWEQSMQNIYSRPAGQLFPRSYDVGSDGRMRAILKLINTKAARSCTII